MIMMTLLRALMLAILLCLPTTIVFAQKQKQAEKPKFDLNAAKPSEIVKEMGVSKAIASAIVVIRAEYGPIKSAADLRRGKILNAGQIKIVQQKCESRCAGSWHHGHKDDICDSDKGDNCGGNPPKDPCRDDCNCGDKCDDKGGPYKGKP